EKRMRRAIDAHFLRDPRLIFVPGLNFPAGRQLAQWQIIWPIAVDLVCRHENERRLRTKISCSLEKIEGAICVHGKIHLRLPYCPIMRRLRSGVDNSVNLAALLFE